MKDSFASSSHDIAVVEPVGVGDVSNLLFFLQLLTLLFCGDSVTLGTARGDKKPPFLLKRWFKLWMNV